MVVRVGRAKGYLLYIAKDVAYVFILEIFSANLLAWNKYLQKQYNDRKIFATFTRITVSWNAWHKILIIVIEK